MPDRLRGFIEKVCRIGVTLSAVRRSSALSPADAPGVLLRGGQFLTATFANQAGTRDYKLYIPSAYQGRPLPLVVMLHGCTQSADDFAAGTRMNMVAEERACFIAYPVQPKSANGSKCWNWFKPGDQQRGRGEPSLIAGITRQISRDYAIDPKRVYVAGLSAGGAAAAIMGATYPDIYAAVGVHSGLPCGAAIDLPSAFSAMRQGTPGAANRSARSFGFHGRGRLVPTIVFHGEKDVTVHPRNGSHVIEQSRSTSLGELRSVTQRGHVLGGRTYSRTSHFDASGRAMLEMWVVHGAGHAWSGGSPAGSYTDPHGPDASREMVRFFLEHQHPHPSEHPI
jgi:poly(hydroxyalkanoate) depolymerase family esterase